MGCYLPFEDIQRGRPDGCQPRVDLGAGSCQNCFPHSGIRGIEMLNKLPAPSFWFTAEGLCLYLAGQDELVQAVMEPHRTSGLAQNWAGK